MRVFKIYADRNTGCSKKYLSGPCLNQPFVFAKKKQEWGDGFLPVCYEGTPCAFLDFKSPYVSGDEDQKIFIGFYSGDRTSGIYRKYIEAGLQDTQDQSLKDRMAELSRIQAVPFLDDREDLMGVMMLPFSSLTPGSTFFYGTVDEWHF